MAVLCGMPTIQYSALSTPLYLIRGFLGPPESSMQMASRSLQPFLQDSLGDRLTARPTDHATRSVTIGHIYMRRTAMRSNNNCSISPLLDWFSCFYHQTKQCNRRQLYSECSRFHTNLFTFGRVIAERVNTAKTHRKVNPVFS